MLIKGGKQVNNLLIKVGLSATAEAFLMTHSINFIQITHIA